MIETPELTVVIPAFNEQECITDCVLEARNVLSGLGRRFEILVIDDGSTDSTYGILQGLKARVPELRAISFRQNRGQTAAMDAGFRHARGNIVITLDADMQNDPRDIPAMLEKLRDWDVICGMRANRRDNLKRRVSSKIANGIRRWLTNDNTTDTGCTLKIYRREYLQRIKLYEGMHRFLPTLLKMAGARVTEMPVNHRPRLKGKAKYGIGNRVFKSFRDCLAVRWMQKRWIRYEIREELD